MSFRDRLQEVAQHSSETKRFEEAYKEVKKKLLTSAQDGYYETAIIVEDSLGAIKYIERELRRENMIVVTILNKYGENMHELYVNWK